MCVPSIVSIRLLCIYTIAFEHNLEWTWTFHHFLGMIRTRSNLSQIGTDRPQLICILWMPSVYNQPNVISITFAAFYSSSSSSSLWHMYFILSTPACETGRTCYIRHTLWRHSIFKLSGAYLCRSVPPLQRDALLHETIWSCLEMSKMTFWHVQKFGKLFFIKQRTH